MFQIITRKDESKAREIDSSGWKIKNKWNWSWIDKKISVDIAKILPKSNWKKGTTECILGDFIRKVGKNADISIKHVVCTSQRDILQNC